MKAKGPYNLCVADSPYGIGQDSRKTKGRVLKKDGSLIKKIDKRNGRPIIVKPKKYIGGQYDDKSPDKEVFDHLISISKNQIFWGANHFISKIPYDSSCWIVWDKCNGTADFADCEMAWTSFRTAVRQFRFMWAGYKQGKSISEGHIMQGNNKLWEDRIHPNHKPIALYKWLLSNYAKQGDKILDPFGGSMSSVIACIDMGFDIDVWELDPDYYASAKNRIQNHVQQLPLFGAPPIINFYE